MSQFFQRKVSLDNWLGEVPKRKLNFLLHEANNCFINEKTSPTAEHGGYTCNPSIQEAEKKEAKSRNIVTEACYISY
jgi:hypothetical protein